MTEQIPVERHPARRRGGGPDPLGGEGLRARVRAFQRAQGLPADGYPGPLTLMQLNRASGVDEPRLRTEP